MANIFAMTDTWTGGTAYTAIQMNVTDTSSTAGSLLLDLQIGGVSKFSVVKDGTVNVLSTAMIKWGATSSLPALKRSGAELQARLGDDSDYTTFRAGDYFSANRRYFFQSRGSLEASTADGVFLMWNNATSGFGRLQFGGTTASFSAIKSSGTTVALRLADDSADALYSAGAGSLSGSSTYTVATAGVVLKQGANGLCGTFVANGITPVTVSNSNVAITDAIIISLNTVGGTVGVQPHVATITAATGFTVICTAVDTSTYNYAIIKNAA